MVITDEQKELLLKHVPNAEKFIRDDNLYELELAIDDQITEYGMDDDFELTEYGRKMQRLYDQIYSQN